MSLARLVVAAVRVQGRSKSEVARDDRVSRRWVHELVCRYDAEGEAGLEPRSRRPRHSPQATPPAVEEQMVTLRKTLVEQGLDAGAHTIAFHLHQRHGSAPSPATIWRILSRRGVVTPQPQKRPKSSYGVYTNKKVLRIAAVTLAALALVFWGQPTGKPILVLAGLLLVALALIEFLGQPPERTAEITTQT